MTVTPFVVIEGVDKSGKSTFIEKMRKYCADHSIEAEFLCDPGSTALGASVRQILKYGIDGEEISDKAELLLFSAVRAQLYETKIKPALTAGKIVFCDRFVMSSLVYQCHAKNKKNAELCLNVHRAFCDIQPSVTYVFNIPYEVWKARKEGFVEESAKADRFEDSTISGYMHKIINGYNFISSMDAIHGRIVSVDATRTEDEVFNFVLNDFKSRFFL
jgi:dTMP kinase